MDDKNIIELYWSRDEKALYETKIKYGGYCRSIAYNILHSNEDAEECENDTYLAAWGAIPPNKPDLLRVFLGKITRNIAVKKLTRYNTARRGGGEHTLPLDELVECVGDGEGMDQLVDSHELAAMIDSFLGTLRNDDRKAFVMRYWYCRDVKDIAKSLRSGESRIKMILKRTRDKLREYLTERGVVI